MMAGNELGATKACCEWSHAIFRLERILRRHQPPYLVQFQELDGKQADVKMTLVGRIERAPQEADTPSITHAGGHVPGASLG